MKVLLVVMVLCQLLLSDAMASIQSRTADGQSKKKGDDSVGLSANNTELHQEYTRSRRSVVPAPTYECYKQFFVNNKPPTGFRPVNSQNIKYICQRFEEFSDTRSLYATMFDEGYGIAIYAGYLVPKKTKFGIFPRVDGWRQGTENIGKQGSDMMYSGNNMNIQKGHLVPAGTYSFDCLSMASTFRYTNAVPQYQSFNGGQWGVYEHKVREFAKQVCGGKNGDLYLLTGISEVVYNVQSKKYKKEQLNYFPDNNDPAAGIAIPNSMWTAGCCVVNNAVRGAFAAIGNNNQLNNKMQQLTVKGLENTLAKGIGGNARIKLFPARNNRCSDKGVQFGYDEVMQEWKEWGKKM